MAQIRLNGSNFLLTFAFAIASKENSASLKIKVSEFIKAASVAV